jgi:outer membrane lipoprotein-sorting protein
LFEYDDPVKKFDYFDGKYYTTYTPDIKQAQRLSLNKGYDDRLVMFQILGNRESPWRDQFPQMEERQDSSVMSKGNRIVLLIPSRKDVPEVLVEVDPSNFLIHRFVSSRPDGARDEFKFTNIRTTPLEDSLFKFVAPPGVDVFDYK